MSVLEKTIEKAVVDYAKKRGCIVRKMNGMGARAWPDRMFLYDGRALFIEFKREGEEPTDLQNHFMTILSDAGFWAVWTDSVFQGKVFIDRFLAGEALL